MSKGQHVMLVHFCKPVAFAGLSDVETWRADKHGPKAPEATARTNVMIAQGCIVIEPIHQDRKGGPSRTVRVPLTNVAYWQMATEAEASELEAPPKE